jgi:hypothetical protein
MSDKRTKEYDHEGFTIPKVYNANNNAGNQRPWPRQYIVTVEIANTESKALQWRITPNSRIGATNDKFFSWIFFFKSDPQKN